MELESVTSAASMFDPARCAHGIKAFARTFGIGVMDMFSQVSHDTSMQGMCGISQTSDLDALHIFLQEEERMTMIGAALDAGLEEDIIQNLREASGTADMSPTASDSVPRESRTYTL